jgi:hypothetical protein
VFASAPLAVFLWQDFTALAQQSPPSVPTFRVSSNLVILDVTVLDKKGRPVVTGLTKDDFTITEDKQPQRIFSFEAPETHVMGPNPEDSNPQGKAPVTIFVLDQLNSSFEDFAFIRYEVRRFLLTQPPQLASPAEECGPGPAGGCKHHQADDSSATQNPKRTRGDGERGWRLHGRG